MTTENKEAPEKVHRKTPTEKMISFAERLAEELGEKLPAQAREDFDSCREWLDEAAARVPPSEKQVTLANRIAEANGMKVPEHIRRSKYMLSKWIDENNRQKAN